MGYGFMIYPSNDVYWTSTMCGVKEPGAEKSMQNQAVGKLWEMLYLSHPWRDRNTQQVFLMSLWHQRTLSHSEKRTSESWEEGEAASIKLTLGKGPQFRNLGKALGLFGVGCLFEIYNEFNRAGSKSWEQTAFRVRKAGLKHESIMEIPCSRITELSKVGKL